LKSETLKAFINNFQADTPILLQSGGNLSNRLRDFYYQPDIFFQQLRLFVQERAEVQTYLPEDDLGGLFTKVSLMQTKVSALKNQDPD
jgi:hypothetical protein